MNEIEENKKSRMYWLVYVSLILSAIMLLAHGLDVSAVARLSTRLGGTILFSAIFIIVGRDRPMAIAATALLWIAFLITVFN